MPYLTLRFDRVLGPEVFVSCVVVLGVFAGTTFDLFGPGFDEQMAATS